VVDQAGVLYPREIRLMTKRLTELEVKTAHQVAVVTVANLQDRPIEQYSLCLANLWGLGRKGIDDGVLMTIAPSERKVRIEVGYGLEKTITDTEAGEIIEKSMIPAFREGLIGRGISAGIEGIAKEIGG